MATILAHRLFRSSRPDYIETAVAVPISTALVVLFRSSRPDYIETTSTGSCPFHS